MFSFDIRASSWISFRRSAANKAFRTAPNGSESEPCVRAIASKISASAWLKPRDDSEDSEDSRSSWSSWFAAWRPIMGSISPRWASSSTSKAPVNRCKKPRRRKIPMASDAKEMLCRKAAQSQTCSACLNKRWSNALLYLLISIVFTGCISM